MEPQVVNSRVHLNHYLTEIPEKEARSLKCKARLYNLATIISGIALVAIMATVLFISYSSIILTETLSLVVAGMALSTVFFSWGISQFKIPANRYYNEAEGEAAVASQLKKIVQIEKWTSLRIEQFLRDNNLNPDLIPKDALRQVNPTEPLKVLLPLIARYLHFEESARTLEKNSREDLRFKIEQDIRKCETKNGPMNRKRQHRLEARGTAYTKLEHVALPRALEAALILQLIQEPTKELSLSNLGKCHAKKFTERKFDLEYEPKNDDYFVFHPNLRKPSLTLQQIEQDTRPTALRQLLFSPPIPIRG